MPIFGIDKFHADKFFWDLGGFLGIVSGTNFLDHAPVKLTLKLRFVVFHDHAKIPKWILKNDSIIESVASLWSSVIPPNKLTNFVLVALFQLKQLLLGNAKDKIFFLSLG